LIIKERLDNGKLIGDLAYSEGKLHQIRLPADGSVDSFSVYYKTIHSFVQ
jgi:hypothetical protein